MAGPPIPYGQVRFDPLHCGEHEWHPYVGGHLGAGVWMDACSRCGALRLDTTAFIEWTGTLRAAQVLLDS